MNAGDAHALVPRAFAADDGDIPFGNLQRAGEDFDQFGVGRAIDGSGRETDEERPVPRARNFGAARAWNDADLEVGVVRYDPVSAFGNSVAWNGATAGVDSAWRGRCSRMRSSRERAS